MKQLVRVFPDYQSSGLWEESSGQNYHESVFEDVLSPMQMLALKYWHQTWEMSMGDIFGECSRTKQWQDQWEADGKALVESFNAYQDIYEFVYVGDNF